MNNESFQVTGEHLSKGDKLQLMRGAIGDFESYLGKTPLRCLSFNSLCLLSGITPTDRDKILHGFKELATNHKTKLTDLPEYKKIVFPLKDKITYTEVVTIQYINAAANSSIPELKGLADNLLKHTKLDLQ